MPMPLKNHFYENLPPFCDVELRGVGSNNYYVATIDGVEGVVIMDGQKQREQQAALDRMVKDTLARKKGYTCRIWHDGIGTEPLYVKHPDHVGPLLRQQYPKLKGVQTGLIVPREQLPPAGPYKETGAAEYFSPENV